MHKEWETLVLNNSDLGTWEALLDNHCLARSVVCMWAEQAGWQAHKFGLRAHGQLVGGLILATRKVPGLPFHLGRISCAMVGPDKPAAMLSALLTEVERFAAANAIVEVELRLRIPTTIPLPGFESHHEISQVLDASDYRALSTVDHTYLVRIDRPDEEILKSFGSTCRNLVRKALKSDAKIAPAADTALLEQFHTSYLAMCRRKNIAGQDSRCVIDGMKALIEKNRVSLFLESYAGRIANMALVDTLGVPCYMLGTQTEAAVNKEVPSHAQALQYGIMKFMRDRGKVLYDLGGCEGPEPQKGHRNYGVWHFKHGFRGEYVDFLPYRRKPLRSLMGPLLNLAHRLRGDPS